MPARARHPGQCLGPRAARAAAPPTPAPLHPQPRHPGGAYNGAPRRRPGIGRPGPGRCECARGAQRAGTRGPAHRQRGAHSRACPCSRPRPARPHRLPGGGVPADAGGDGQRRIACHAHRVAAARRLSRRRGPRAHRLRGQGARGGVWEGWTAGRGRARPGVPVAERARGAEGAHGPPMGPGGCVRSGRPPPPPPRPAGS